MSQIKDKHEKLNNQYETACIEAIQGKITGHNPAFDNTEFVKTVKLNSSSGQTVTVQGRECPRCGSVNTIVHKQQTRSSDEPETEACYCIDCSAKF